MDKHPNDPSVLARLHGSGPDQVPIILRDTEGADRSQVVRVPAPGSDETHEGRYSVIGEIARGGVGVVLKAHDVDLGRDVAMKVIRDEYAEHPEVIQRFVEEAQIGGQLQHPGIVPVYEIGLKKDKRPYFTMKLVKGKTLSLLLSERDDITKGRRRYLSMFESICQTVGYAHARGVIHRDLKPANIMVGSFGEVVVVDWGMGKVLQRGGVQDEKKAAAEAERTVVATVRSNDEASGSMVGSVLGTPRYMPPEQARGDLEAVDERSDVFALGGILCAILTGEPTYSGVGSEVLFQAARADVQEAIERLEASGADPELIDLAIQCLAPAPSARPADAGHVAECVGAYLSSIEERVQEARVEAAAAEVRAAEERKARRLTALLATVVVLALVGAGGAWRWFEQRRQDRESRITSQVNEALREATLHRGQERWPQALAAATRAEELAAEAPADVLERAAAERADLAVHAHAAALEATLADDNQRLRAGLDAARPPEGDDRYPTNWRATNDAYAQVFHDQGLNPERGSPEEAATLLRARGISTDLAAALDGWVVVRRMVGDNKGAGRLSRVADLVDGDPQRARIRLAIIERDAATLKALATKDNVLDLPVVTLQLLGSGLRNVGAVREAAAFLHRAHRRHPGDLLLCLHLARALHQSGRQGDSVRYFVAALALRPGSPVVTSEAGQEFLNVGEPERAEEVFREGLKARPQDAVLHIQLANALLVQGRIQEAGLASDEAVRLDEGSPWVRVVRGVILIQTGRPEKGVAEMEVALRLGPDMAQVHWIASGGYAMLQRFDLAHATALRAVELDPEALWGHLRLTATMSAVGRQVEAIKSAREAVRRGPQHFETHDALGTALIALRFLDEGIEELRTALRINEESLNGWIHLMYALHFKGDNIQALQCLKRARALNKDLDRLAPRLVPLFETIERRARAEPRLIAILEGHLPAESAEQMVDAAITGASRDWPLASVHQLAQAFETDRAYTADPKKLENHFSGCIAAARATLGKGDAADLSAQERTKVAMQGLAWLREMLELRRKEPPDQIARIMVIWLESPHFAGLRDEQGLSLLPAQLRADLRAHWAQVRKVVAQAQDASK